MTIETSPSLIGQQLGHWKIEKRLGEGGMSEIFVASHAWLGQKKAAKLLRPELCRNKVLLERFKQEAFTVSRLKHKNIIEISDFGFEPQHGYFMILELLEGRDLEETLTLEAPPLPKSWILNITEQICSGLSAIHAADVIHRDLKPSNIFLVPNPKSPFPTVKILDFGIAKVGLGSKEEGKNLTATDAIVGTPYYLAPEQIKKTKELSASTDIYSLGVILYQLFTGKLPFSHEYLIDLFVAVHSHQPPTCDLFRPDLAETGLVPFFTRMLSKDPTERPASMENVWLELQQACSSFQDPLERSSTPSPQARDSTLPSLRESLPTEDFAKQTKGKVKSFKTTPATEPQLSHFDPKFHQNEASHFPSKQNQRFANAPPPRHRNPSQDNYDFELEEEEEFEPTVISLVDPSYLQQESKEKKAHAFITKYWIWIVVSTLSLGTSMVLALAFWPVDEPTLSSEEEIAIIWVDPKKKKRQSQLGAKSKKEPHHFKARPQIPEKKVTEPLLSLLKALQKKQWKQAEKEYLFLQKQRLLTPRQNKVFSALFKVRHAVQSYQFASRRGHLSKARAALIDAKQYWEVALRHDRWKNHKSFKTFHQTQVIRLPQISRVLALQKKAQSVYRRAKFSKVRELYRKMQIELAGSTFASKLNKQIKAKRNKMQRANSFLQCGDNAFRTKRWRRSYQCYQKYLKAFPRSWQRTKLRIRLKRAKCKQKPLWDPCHMK